MRSDALRQIPKRLHQTYKTAEIPPFCRELVDDLRRLHTDWDYRFYDDAACERFIAQQLPDLLAPYRRPCLLPVQRADLFRLAVVYVTGGFYLDLDMRVHRALDDLLDHPAVFATEAVLSEAECRELGHRDATRVANYAFGAVPGHPFLGHLLGVLAENLPLGGHARTEEDVLEQTGPGFLTTCFHRYRKPDGDHGIRLLGLSDRLCPKCGARRCQFGDYASHLHMGSWRWAS